MEKNVNILFVDDEQPVLNGIKRIFHTQRNDWELFFANSGDEALKMVDQHKFDLVVSDGKMPGMSGIELLQKLREREDTKDIPTIMLTGYVDDEMRKDALRSGIIEFVNKPVIPDEFVLRIENVLKLKNLHTVIKEKSDRIEEANNELKGLYSTVKNQKEELEELNNAKSKFMEIAMNDFKNTAQIVLSNSKILINKMDSETDDDKIKILEKILKTSENMQDIFTRLMNVTDITSGVLKLNYTKVNLLDYVNECFKDVKEWYVKKSVNLVFFHDNILPIDIYVDKVKLRIAIFSLLENAIKYSSENSDVEFYLHYKESNIIFRIKDSGIGMTDDEIESLFEFNKSDLEKTKGISLPIVKKIVVSHKGEISVESKFGQGSEFIISIPVQ
ncbi:MAG: hybrid sensor histidine kinase/response regulator [Candidatus Delongbacteria bacterium]|jgi:signal transduction histidine kinase|nr:hybrid sensor histidine kinase/response regulator [Candidatus Delongbacteria bacterium]